MDGRYLVVIILIVVISFITGAYVGGKQQDNLWIETWHEISENYTLIPNNNLKISCDCENDNLKYINNELVELVGIPEYHLNSSEVYNLAEKDEYNQPMFWIEDYTEKIVWILLPNSSGHLKAYVEDIDNLSTTYRIIDEFNSNETWK